MKIHPTDLVNLVLDAASLVEMEVSISFFAFHMLSMHVEEHALHGQGMAHTLLLNAMAMKLQRGHYEESWKVG